MSQIKSVLTAAVVSFLSLFLFVYSCGNKNENTSGTDTAAPTGAVRVSLTSGPSSIEQSIATIETVRIGNAATGAGCDALSIPVTINLVDLANLTQVLSVQECPAGDYTTVHIEFDKSLSLMTAVSGTSTGVCSFSSWKDEANTTHALDCSGPVCSLDLPVSLMVPEQAAGKLTLDFDAGSFEVTAAADPAACAVAFKRISLFTTGTGQDKTEAVTGLISDLTTTASTFSLVRGSALFTVDYSSMPADRKPGLDSLLTLAQSGSLRVKVESADIGMMNGTVQAKDIFVKMQGVVSNLSAETGTCTVTLNGSDSYTVDNSHASVNGVLAEGAWAMIRLSGSDGTNWTASKVDVCPGGMPADS